MFDINYKKGANESIYKSLECEDSLFIFNKKSSIRKLSYKIVTYKYFDDIVSSFVIISLF